MVLRLTWYSPCAVGTEKCPPCRRPRKYPDRKRHRAPRPIAPMLRKRKARSVLPEVGLSDRDSLGRLGGRIAALQLRNCSIASGSRLRPLRTKPDGSGRDRGIPWGVPHARGGRTRELSGSRARRPQGSSACPDGCARWQSFLVPYPRKSFSSYRGATIDSRRVTHARTTVAECAAPLRRPQA